MLELSGWPELSVSLSWLGFERERSRGPGLGDRPPLRAAEAASAGRFRMSVIINRDRVAAVCGMALVVLSCTVMPDSVPDNLPPTPNTLDVQPSTHQSKTEFKHPENADLNLGLTVPSGFTELNAILDRSGHLGSKSAMFQSPPPGLRLRLANGTAAAEGRGQWERWPCP